MNEVLGNFGRTVFHTEAIEVKPVNQFEDMKSLVEDIEAGEVEVLVVLGGNPVFDAPADFDFSELLRRLPLSIHLTLDMNETARECTWVIPESHYLESWGDARAFDGTVSIVQPLILPLYQSKSPQELLAAIRGNATLTDYQLVRGYWQEQYQDSDFDRWWRRGLHDGVIEGTASPQMKPKVDQSRLSTQTSDPRAEGIDVLFRPDPSVFDGRYANNGWLQELPKELTRLTWDNAALVSPALAESYDLSNGDVVEVRAENRSIEAPVWIRAGQPANSVTLHLGYGRKVVGRVGKGTGFNVYPLRTSATAWWLEGASISKTGRHYALACTQDHSTMEGRDLIRRANLEDYRQDSHIFEAMGHDLGSESELYPGFEYTGYAWGMAVDLNACIGCNACTIACQAENNIAIVGKEEVLNGREMHWIRVDRYFSNQLDDPRIYHQPVMCQHCENAPCESVCPVAATVHGEEGLNEMVYNRCIGTRYCSNNCPYKVRRFNFLLYSDWQTDSLKLQRNPNVTVRSRGVMEKCTYCVQRISLARIQAKLEDRKIADGDVKSACQQVCPADAIVFGDVNDPESKVSQLRKNPRNYGILTELRTVPRTTYLAKLENPNPKLEEK
jgi:molybdopterin-containing oxidoreductase family iron-sulfur binding subunit